MNCLKVTDKEGLIKYYINGRRVSINKWDYLHYGSDIDSMTTKIKGDKVYQRHHLRLN